METKSGDETLAGNADRIDTTVIVYHTATDQSASPLRFLVIASDDYMAKLRDLIRYDARVIQVIVGEIIAHERAIERVRQDLRAEADDAAARRERAEFDRLKAIYEPCKDN